MPIVHVVATFTAAAGREDELEKVLLEMLEPTRAEAGCIRYDLLRSLPGVSPVEFTFVEEWESIEALDAHGRTPHLQGLRPKVQGLAEGPPRVVRYFQAG
ncbi:MAG: putative quinol monooxygenase [Thermoanaerobaculia bacterium]